MVDHFSLDNYLCIIIVGILYVVWLTTKCLQLFVRQVDNQLKWPDSAVSAVTALEKASHEALSTDFTKYNQKLRQLCFNLKVSLVYAYLLFFRCEMNVKYAIISCVSFMK